MIWPFHKRTTSDAARMLNRARHDRSHIKATARQLREQCGLPEAKALR